MASLFEIHEPGALQYNTTLGFTYSDSGQGLPGQRLGTHRRVGRHYNTPGDANCSSWNSSSSVFFGTAATLVVSWSLPATQSAPWVVVTNQCDNPAQVWCASD